MNLNNPTYRKGFLHGASATAIGAGLFFGEKRNWALVALGALGVFLAQGGTISAEDVKVPKLPSLPSMPEGIPVPTPVPSPATAPLPQPGPSGVVMGKIIRPTRR